MKTLLLVAVTVAVAALPTSAHAEFRAQPGSEIRPSRKAKAAVARTAIAKPDHTPVRDEPILSVDNVLAKITKNYLPGLQRCFRKSLELYPAMKGKVALVFTVDEKGHVLSDLGGVNPTFDKCLGRLVTAWRFPHAPIEPVEATFKISLVLAK